MDIAMAGTATIDRGATLAALAGLFADPSGPEGASLAEDAARAAEDEGHEPAFAGVAVMLALFPDLAPEATPAPSGP